MSSDYVDNPLIGAEICHQGIALSGDVTSEEWIKFLSACIPALGMTSAGDHKVWNYPVGGKGGQGMTVVMPLTESFLALDTYDNHCGAYLFVASCRPFSRSQIEPVVAKFGLEYVDESPFAVLRLRE